jgi:hypothetical protein
MILRLLCIWLVFYSLLSSLILSNLKHEFLNRLRSTMAPNVLICTEYTEVPARWCLVRMWCLRFSSAFPHKYRLVPTSYPTTTSFHILSNSQFMIVQIQSHTIRITGNIVKWPTMQTRGKLNKTSYNTNFYLKKYWWHSHECLIISYNRNPGWRAW